MDELEKPNDENTDHGRGGDPGAVPGDSGPPDGGDHAGLVIPYHDLLFEIVSMLKIAQRNMNSTPKVSRKFYFHNGAYGMATAVINSVRANWGPGSAYQKGKK